MILSILQTIVRYVQLYSTAQINKSDLRRVSGVMGHGVSHSASNYIPDPGLRNLSPLITHPPDNTKYIVRFFRNSVICQQRAAPCRRHRCIHLLRWVWPVSTNEIMALFPIDQRYGHLATSQVLQVCFCGAPTDRFH